MQKGFKNEKTKRLHGFEIINLNCSIGFNLPDVSCLSFTEGRQNPKEIGG